MQNNLNNIVYIIGMPRAGTTFLYHNLSKHPSLYVPFRRKTNYFSLHREKPIEWFLDHFKEMPDNKLGIDTETLFFVDKNLQSYKKIKDTNPNAKVMLFVRKPDEWVYSFYKQIATFDKDIGQFKDFLDGKYILTEDAKQISFNIKDEDIQMLIEDIRKEFGNNLLLVNFTLFQSNPLKLLQEIETFLGLNTYFDDNNFQNKKINASNRGHITLLANLLRKQWVITILSKLPSKFIKTIRIFYDNISLKLGGNNTHVDTEEEKNLKLAAKYFKNDINYYYSLFKQSDIL